MSTRHTDAIPARHKMPFTPEDDATIRSGAEQGLFYWQVGEALERTQWSIENRARKLGIKFDSPEKKMIAGLLACASRDPKKHSRGMSEKAWSPERRAAHSAKMRQMYAEGRNGNIGRKGAKRSPETVAKIVAGVTRAHAEGKMGYDLSWLPKHKRGRYEYFRARLGPAGAKERMTVELALERALAVQAEAARVAALPPFERMLERARKFGITERPRMVANDYDYSLIGSALA